MSDDQQGNAEELAQGNGHDRQGTADRDHEWVRREELSAVVTERNEWKRKYRDAAARLEELSQPGDDENAQQLADAEQRYERLWVDHQILSAADAADAVSGPAVVQLFRSRVRTRRDESGRPQAVVTDSRGEPVHDAEGRPLPIAEAVKRFLAEPGNAFLIRSRYPGGGGTGAGPRRVPASASLDELSAEQIARLSDSEFERLNAQRRRNRQGFRW